MFENTGDDRKSARAHLSISETEVSCAQSREIQPGSLRDISAHGAFVYAPLKPNVGDRITIRFAVEGTLASTHVRCDGIVVRVEKPKAGGPTGIAVEFTRLDMAA